MQGTVPNGAACREMSRIVEESEGHFMSFNQRPLFLLVEEALAEPKDEVTAACDGEFCKRLQQRVLEYRVTVLAQRLRQCPPVAKCRILHIRCKHQPPTSPGKRNAYS